MIRRFLFVCWAILVIFNGDTNWQLNADITFPEQWQRVGPAIISQQINDAHYENGMWITVGNRGELFASENGLAWHVANGTGSGNLNVVTFGDDHWLAAGPRTLLTSLDGLNWEQHSSEFDFKSVGFGNDAWVAVESDRILWSLDGLKWKIADHPSLPGPETHYQKVLFGQHGFVVIGSFGVEWKGYQMFMMYSTNGIEWALVHSGGLLAVPGVDGDFGDGRWNIVGGSGDGRFSAPNYEAWTSTNGTDWTLIPDTSFFTVRHGPDGWVAISYHNQTFVGEFRVIWTSDSGTEWNDSRRADGMCLITDLVGGEDSWLEFRKQRGGGGGEFSHSLGLVSNKTTVGRSCGGAAWSKVWFQGGRWIAASRGRIISSENASDWAESVINMEGSFEPLYLAYQQGVWLLICQNIHDGHILSLVSDDSLVWNKTWIFGESDLLPGGIRTLYPRSLVVADGRFMLYSSTSTSVLLPDGSVTLSGRAKVYTSQDGIEWGQASVEVPGSHFLYGNDQFIISHPSAHELFVSKDTRSWTGVKLDGRGSILSLVRGNDGWAAFGQSLYISENGYDWVKAKEQLPFRGNLTFGGDFWVLTDGSGKIALSDDLKNWSINKSSDPFLRFGTIAFGNNLMVSTHQLPYLTAGHISHVKSDSLPDISLKYFRSDNVLELSWSLDHGQILLESAPAPNGPWRTFRRFRGQETSTQVFLEPTQTAVRSTRYFRCVLE